MNIDEDLNGQAPVPPMAGSKAEAPKKRGGKSLPSIFTVSDQRQGAQSS